MTKKLALLIGATVLLFASVILLKTGNIGTTALWNLSDQGTWLLPLIVVASLMDSINPCAFGILLLTISFLLALGKTRSGVLRIGGVYILGLSTVYLLIGLGILQTLHLFNTPHFIAKVGASLLIVLGAINIINEFFPAFPIKLRIPKSAHHKMAELMNKASLPAVFLLGGLVALCEIPCTGGPYFAILALLDSQVEYVAGLGYLVLYNLIFVSPLILILFIASDTTLLEKVQEWKNAETKNMRLWGGVGMVILGLFMFTL